MKKKRAINKLALCESKHTHTHRETHKQTNKTGKTTIRKMLITRFVSQIWIWFGDFLFVSADTLTRWLAGVRNAMGPLFEAAFFHSHSISV